jgi:hypothetical protein
VPSTSGLTVGLVFLKLSRSSFLKLDGVGFDVPVGEFGFGVENGSGWSDGTFCSARLRDVNEPGNAGVTLIDCPLLILFETGSPSSLDLRGDSIAFNGLEGLDAGRQLATGTSSSFGLFALLSPDLSDPPEGWWSIRLAGRGGREGMRRVLRENKPDRGKLPDAFECSSVLLSLSRALKSFLEIFSGFSSPS